MSRTVRVTLFIDIPAELRMGWDVWGNEVDSHVEIGAQRA